MEKTLIIKTKDEEFKALDDIDLIANNLEFLGFAMVTDKYSSNRMIITTDILLSIQEID